MRGNSFGAKLHSQTVHMILSSTVASAAFAALPALAADITMPQAISAKSYGRMQSAETAARGAWQLGLVMHGSTGAAPEKQGEHVLADAKGSRAHQAMAVLGYSPLDRLELSLGVRATYESQTGFEQARQSRLAGAVGGMKFQLLNWQGLKIAAGLHGEAGSGKTSDDALASSREGKGGWSTTVSYGEQGIGEITFHGGMRYRNPEQFGSYLLRNEAFYGGYAKGWLSKHFAIYGGALGRRLMVREMSDEVALSDDDAKEMYRPQYAGELTGGLVARVGGAELSLYAAGPTGSHQGLGESKTSGGLSVSFVLGGTRDSSAERTIVREVKSEREVSDRAKKDLKEQALPAAAPAVVDENAQFEAVYERDLNLGMPIDGEDDFSKMKKTQKSTNEAEARRIEEWNRAQTELEQLRDRAMREEASRAEVERAEQERRRGLEREAAQARAIQERELREEASERARGLPGVSDRELNRIINEEAVWQNIGE